MDKIEKEFREKFNIDELTIYENDNWIWSLRPKQITFGSSILSFKKTTNELSKLTVNEFMDLHDVIQVCEKTLKKVLGYSIINYLMLMLVDKQLHYHVVPRYSEPIIYNGTKYEDKLWPNPPKMNVDMEVTEEELLELVKTLKITIKE